MEGEIMNKPSNNRLLKAGTIGIIVTAFCCFTPILVVLLGVLGLGAFTGYLDYVLLPALSVFFIIMIYGLVQRQKSSRECRTPSAD
jgi:mercuric ion transport protein|tara:strand:- start:161 stop:418 length:258 start_codon:yes stop_codon:yes gene_type:complete